MSVRRLLSLGPFVALGAGALGILAPHAAPHAGRDQQADARQIFLSDCATCHGAQAEGTDDGPSLEGAGTALVDYELSTGRMPLPSPDADVVRRTPKYDHDTIRALVAYVGAIAPGGPPIPSVDVVTADLAQGGQDFRLACAACHQAAGQGGALRYGEAPSLRSSSAVEVAEAMRTGPGTMPVFGADAFSDGEVAGIAAYVEYLRDPQDRGGEPLWHFGPLAEGMIAFLATVGLAGVLVVIGQRR